MKVLELSVPLFLALPTRGPIAKYASRRGSARKASPVEALEAPLRPCSLLKDLELRDGRKVMLDFLLDPPMSRFAALKRSTEVLEI